MEIKYLIFGLILGIFILIFVLKRKEKFGFWGDIQGGFNYIKSGIDDAVEDVENTGESAINAIENEGIKIGNAIVSTSGYLTSGAIDTADIVKNDITGAYYTTVGSVDVSLNAVKNETLSGVKLVTSAGDYAFKQAVAFADTQVSDTLPLFNSSWSVIVNDTDTAVNFANNTIASADALTKMISKNMLAGLIATENAIVTTGELILKVIEGAICDALV